MIQKLIRETSPGSGPDNNCRLSSCKEILEARHQTTTWALLTGRDPTKVPDLTGGTTSRGVVERRTMMEDRTSTAEEKRVGNLDLGRDTREEEEDTGGVATEEEGGGMEGPGALRRGLAEENFVGGETTGETTFVNVGGGCRGGTSSGLQGSELVQLVFSGTEEEAPVGPVLESTLMITVARMRALMGQMKWGEDGTTGAEGGCLEEVHPGQEVREPVPARPNLPRPSNLFNLFYFGRPAAI